jgi:glycosyltransferase involved in cell wall biosynthesis
MKIAIVAHNYLPHIGGVEFYVKRLSDSLTESGTGAVVLTTDMDTPEAGRKPEARYFKTTVQLMRNPLSLEMIRHLRKNEYDILHLHSVWFLPCLAAVFFRKKARIISTIHGVYPDSSSALLRTFLGLYKPLVGYILRKSEKVLVYSRIEKEKLQKHFHVPDEKIGILPMAIHVEEDTVHPKSKVILFTGRIIPDKNPDLLIKAAALLDAKFSEYSLTFVGPVDEAYKQFLVTLAGGLNLKNKLVFTGQLDPSVPSEKNQLLQHYRTASAFVSVGSWEGQPTRLMEAMQFRVPVIAYASGGTADFVTDNKNGCVIDVLDEKLLADKLEMILSDDTLAAELGSEARKTVVNDYNWKMIFEKIDAIYHGH